MEDKSAVSYVVYEGTQERTAQREKRFFVVIILLIALLVATNAGWIIYEMSMETVTKTVTIESVEQQTDGAENKLFDTIVGGDYYGEQNKD